MDRDSWYVSDLMAYIELNLLLKWREVLWYSKNISKQYLKNSKLKLGRMQANIYLRKLPESNIQILVMWFIKVQDFITFLMYLQKTKVFDFGLCPRSTSWSHEHFKILAIGALRKHLKNKETKSWNVTSLGLRVCTAYIKIENIPWRWLTCDTNLQLRQPQIYAFSFHPNVKDLLLVYLLYNISRVMFGSVMRVLTLALYLLVQNAYCPAISPLKSAVSWLCMDCNWSIHFGPRAITRNHNNFKKCLRKVAKRISCCGQPFSKSHAPLLTVLQWTRSFRVQS